MMFRISLGRLGLGLGLGLRSRSPLPRNYKYYSTDASFEPPVSRLRDRIKSYAPAFLAWTIFGSEALHLLWLRQDYNSYKEKTNTRILILNNLIERLESGEAVDIASVLCVGDFKSRSFGQNHQDPIDYSSAADDDEEWIKLFDQAREHQQISTAKPVAISTRLLPSHRPSPSTSQPQSPPSSSGSTSPQRPPPDTSKFL